MPKESRYRGDFAEIKLLLERLQHAVDVYGKGLPNFACGAFHVCRVNACYLPNLGISCTPVEHQAFKRVLASRKDIGYKFMLPLLL